MPDDIDFGAFLPTTDIFDRTLIDDMDLNSEDFKDFLVRLYQTTNNISTMVNIKTSGYHVETEFVNGNLWFQNKSLTGSRSQTYRQEFSKVFDFGALPNATTKALAHGLTVTDELTFTQIYGAATDTTGHTYIPIPFASPTLNLNISVELDATSITVTTGIDRTAYDTCYIVIKYLKS
jgi:hypothetical protein